MFFDEIVQCRAADFEELCGLSDVVAGEHKGPVHAFALAPLSRGLQRQELFIDPIRLACVQS